jgi:hypothetical protein
MSYSDYRNHVNYYNDINSESSSGNYDGSSGNYDGSSGNSEERDLCTECVETHDQKYGQNYIWLDALGHGPVKTVWFCEPANSNEYILYTTEWWEIHCKVVSHSKNLFDEHYKAFVNPQTRFARMIFLFEDNTLRDANEDFYRLEQEYYDKQGLCNY